jgi:carboxymethylenebutenolidase
MGEFVKLKAEDGNELSAYVSRPSGAARGAVVVVQEIFGVNSQIRGVADMFASQGYVGIAPATFDRYEPGLELKDTGDDLKKAYEMYGKLKPETALLDVAAAYKFVEGEDHKGIAVVGFCYGGLMAWLSATRGEDLKMQPSCTVGYYPGGVGKVATEEPSCPVMLHFGGADSHIGTDQIDAVRTAHPDVEIFVYEGAEHAFAGTERAAYNPEQAKLAQERTLAFLATHIA